MAVEHQVRDGCGLVLKCDNQSAAALTSNEVGLHGADIFGRQFTVHIDGVCLLR
jgi:hypothetical protein